MTHIARTRGVVKNYGKKTVLRGVDLQIERGRIVGLIGPNGAGKTTLLRALLGLTDFEGDLEVLGMDPRIERDKMMERVCFIADIAVLPRWLRVSDAVRFMRDIHPRFNEAKALELLSRTKVSQDARVKQLSKGMVAQLHLALVMAIDAEFLVLDEPTLGLDVLFRKSFYDTLLTDYFDEQRTILVTTHQFEEVERILSDVMFIDDGNIVMDESVENLAERFVEVLVPRQNSEQARSLGALYEREIFGKHVFLFENANREQLAELGELHTPSVTDIFVAKMQAGAA